MRRGSSGLAQRMGELGVDVLLLSTGADLPYLTGYEAMPLERLTMLVVPAEGDAVLVVPRLEAPRVVEQPDAFSIRSWEETEDPIAVVAGLVGAAPTAAIGDHTWARFVIDLQDALPNTRFRRAVDVTGPLRVVKDAAEIDALRAAAVAVDAIAEAMRAERFSGRREVDVHRELVERMLDAGHERANFAIVATGPERGQPAPRSDGPRDRTRRHRAVRLRRHDARLLLRHHAHVQCRRAHRGGARRVRRARGSAGARRARGDRRHHVRSRRRGDAHGDRRRAAMASSSCTAPVTGSAPRPTRIPTWSRGTALRSCPGTRSASSPGSTFPNGSGCGSRTSWWQRPRGRSASTRHRATSRSSTERPPMQLDLATVLVQVATGGLLFCWVTTRRREVGLGYGWLLRISFGTIAILGVIAGVGDSGAGAQVRNVGAAVMALAAGGRALGVVRAARRGRQRAASSSDARDAERVAAMVGTTRDRRR